MNKEQVKEIGNIIYLLEVERKNTKSEADYKRKLRNECIIKLMYYLAKEPGEIAKIKIDDFIVNEGRIILYGRNQYTVDIIDSELNDILIEHIKENKPGKYLFESVDKKKIAIRTYKRIISEAMNKGNIDISLPEIYLKNLRIKDLKENHGFTQNEVFYWLGYRKKEENNIEFSVYNKIEKMKLII